jgi:ABC-2 type transport system permease protein
MTALVLARPAPRRKYLAVALVALRQRLSDRSVLIARAVFYVLVLFIFSRIWRALDHGASRYLWYLAVTEWITLSQPRLYLEIERDVRSGDIAYHLTRPVSYLWTRLAEAAGELVLAMGVLGAVGIGATALLAGGLPADPRGLVLAGVLGVLAAALLLLCNAAIGISAFWLQDCSPLYWLWQKAAFVLGGLFVPLSLYPEWLRVLSLWLPFSAMVSGPGSMVLEADVRIFALQAIRLLACLGMVAHFLDALYDRAVERLELNGG